MTRKTRLSLPSHYTSLYFTILYIPDPAATTFAASADENIIVDIRSPITMAGRRLDGPTSVLYVSTSPNASATMGATIPTATTAPASAHRTPLGVSRFHQKKAATDPTAIPVTTPCVRKSPSEARLGLWKTQLASQATNPIARLNAAPSPSRTTTIKPIVLTSLFIMSLSLPDNPT